MSNEDLSEKALTEENEEKQYIFYSSKETGDIGKIESSSEFHQEFIKLLKREKRKRNLRNLGQNIACLITIIIGSFSLMCTLDRDVRATCFQWIKTKMNGGMTDYKTTSSDMVSPDKANEPVAGFSLEYIPDGYVLKSADMGEDTGNVTYCQGSNQLLFYYINTKDTNTLINNENSNLSHIELNDGTVCDLYKNTSDDFNSKLIWQKESFTCTLFASGFDTSELIQIAEGVKKINS